MNKTIISAILTFSALFFFSKKKKTTIVIDGNKDEVIPPPKKNFFEFKIHYNYIRIKEFGDGRRYWFVKFQIENLSLMKVDNAYISKISIYGTPKYDSILFFRRDYNKSELKFEISELGNYLVDDLVLPYSNNKVFNLRGIHPAVLSKGHISININVGGDVYTQIGTMK